MAVADKNRSQLINQTKLKPNSGRRNHQRHNNRNVDQDGPGFIEYAIQSGDKNALQPGYKLGGAGKRGIDQLSPFGLTNGESGRQLDEDGQIGHLPIFSVAKDPKTECLELAGHHQPDNLIVISETEIPTQRSNNGVSMQALSLLRLNGPYRQLRIHPLFKWLILTLIVGSFATYRLVWSGLSLDDWSRVVGTDTIKLKDNFGQKNLSSGGSSQDKHLNQLKRENNVGTQQNSPPLKAQKIPNESVQSLSDSSQTNPTNINLPSTLDPNIPPPPLPPPTSNNTNTTTQPPLQSCILDRSHTTFLSLNRFLADHRDTYLRVITGIGQVIIDFWIVFITLRWLLYGQNIRVPSSYAFTFGVRALFLTTTKFPFPSHLIWQSPKIPSLTVPYDITRDFFFSGHTSTLVLPFLEEFMRWLVSRRRKKARTDREGLGTAAHIEVRNTPTDDHQNLQSHTHPQTSIQNATPQTQNSNHPLSRSRRLTSPPHPVLLPFITISLLYIICMLIIFQGHYIIDIIAGLIYSTWCYWILWENIAIVDKGWSLGFVFGKWLWMKVRGETARTQEQWIESERESGVEVGINGNRNKRDRHQVEVDKHAMEERSEGLKSEQSKDQKAQKAQKGSDQSKPQPVKRLSALRNPSSLTHNLAVNGQPYQVKSQTKVAHQSQMKPVQLSNNIEASNPTPQEYQRAINEGIGRVGKGTKSGIIQTTMSINNMINNIDGRLINTFNGQFKQTIPTGNYSTVNDNLDKLSLQNVTMNISEIYGSNMDGSQIVDRGGATSMSHGTGLNMYNVNNGKIPLIAKPTVYSSIVHTSINYSISDNTIQERGIDEVNGETMEELTVQGFWDNQNGLKQIKSHQERTIQASQILQASQTNSQISQPHILKYQSLTLIVYEDEDGDDGGPREQVLNVSQRIIDVENRSTVEEGEMGDDSKGVNDSKTQQLSQIIQHMELLDEGTSQEGKSRLQQGDKYYQPSIESGKQGEQSKSAIQGELDVL